MRNLLRTPQSALDELDARFGPMVAMGAGPLRMVVIGKPTLIRELLMQPNDRFRADAALSPFPFVVGKYTMISSDGADHRRRRGAVQHAFSRRRLNRWIPMIIERTDAAIDDLLATSPIDRPVDLYPIIRRLLIDIVIRALFGERLVTRTAEIDARFARAQAYLSSPLYRQIPHPIPFTLRAGVRQDRRALDHMIDDAIVRSRAEPHVDSDADHGGDVLDVLVHRSDLSDAEIRDQVKTLIGAGYDTTASSLAWILWEAGTRPELWQHLRHEADSVLRGDQHADAESLISLDLANREALRMHPASGIATRQTATDVIVGDYVLAKGTLAVWSPYLAGRDRDAWAHSDRFEPDRYIDPDATKKSLAEEAWTPFGRGPRMCVGFALATMELVLVTARLAQRIDLTPISTDVPDPVGLIVSRPLGGVPMHLRPRP